MPLIKRTSIPQDPTAGDALRNAFSPQALSFQPHSVQIGTQWSRVYAIINFPSSVGPAWLSRAANLEGVTLAFHALPTDSSQVTQALNRAIGQLEGSLAVPGQTALAKQRAESQVQDAQALMRSLDIEQHSLFTVGVFLLVSADNAQKGERRAKRVEAACAAAGMRARTLSFRQESGLHAVGPWGLFPLELRGQTPFQLPVNTVAAALPFTAKGINHGHGIVLGTAGDPGHAEIVLIDRWNPPPHAGLINKNMTILAPTGGGKTYAAILMLLREWVQGVKVFILDPEKREYQQVCRYCGGNWLNAAGGRTRINPFQAWAIGDVEGLSPLSLHIQRVLSFLHTLMPGLSSIAHALLAAAVRETYEAHEISLDVDPQTLSPDQWPHMGHLYHICRDHAIQDPQPEWQTLTALLQEPAIGVLSPLWAGPSTVPTTHDADFLVADLMDLKDAPEAVKRAQYLNVLGYLWDLIRQDKTQRKILVVDEAWMLIDKQNPDTLRFLKQVAKLIRGYNGSLMTITQNVFDFLAPSVRDDGEPVLTNAAATLLLRQDRRNLQALVELFDLSEHEQTQLTNATVGHGLLIAGNARSWVHITASVAEERAMGE